MPKSKPDPNSTLRQFVSLPSDERRINLLKKHLEQKMFSVTIRMALKLACQKLGIEPERPKGAL